jgi:membrane fusion protein, heavy metal efflux system
MKFYGKAGRFEGRRPPVLPSCPGIVHTPYSTDLAAAKSDFQTKFVQWKHDVKLFNLRQKLVSTGAISQQLLVDTRNDEQKSRLDYNLARDKLTAFYEIPEEDLNQLLERISDIPVDKAAPAPDDADKKKPSDFGNVENKAKMTLRSKADGYVISREAVPGKVYTSTDVLTEISPLDHLWVFANVNKPEHEKVRVGQALEVQFPFLSQTVRTHVDYVTSNISNGARTVKIRGSIPGSVSRSIFRA